MKREDFLKCKELDCFFGKGFEAIILLDEETKKLYLHVAYGLYDGFEDVPLEDISDDFIEQIEKYVGNNIENWTL